MEIGLLSRTVSSPIRSLGTLEQASSSPSDVPVAYSFVFRRSVERLSHATDHEHSSFAISDEILFGTVPLDHFRNGDERSVSPGPMTFL